MLRFTLQLTTHFQHSLDKSRLVRRPAEIVPCTSSYTFSIYLSGPSSTGVRSSPEILPCCSPRTPSHLASHC